MSTLVHEITENGVCRLREVLRQEDYTRSVEDAQGAFAAIQTVVQGIDSSWLQINEQLDDGVEGRQLRFLLLELRDVLHLAAYALPQIRIKIRESPAFTTKDTALSDLDIFTKRVDGIREDVDKLISWLDALPPKIDETSLSVAPGVPQAAGYITSEEMLAWLSEPSRR